MRKIVSYYIFRLVITCFSAVKDKHSNPIKPLEKPTIINNEAAFSAKGTFKGFYSPLRKLSPAAPEHCYSCLGALLQLSCNIVTEPLE